MKISIARLKEIIMEEVARAAAIEEEDVPGSEGYEKQIEDDETAAEAEKKKRREKASRSSLRYMAGKYGPGPSFDQQESLNIELVDDE